MTLQKWIKERAIHGYPTFSIEDVREIGMYSSEQIMKNELNRLCSNKTIANVYRGFYVIIPVHYVLRGSVPATYYIDQLMAYLSKPYYVCMLSAEVVFEDNRQVKQLIMEKSSIVHELYQNNPDHPLFKTFYLKNIHGSMNNLGHVKGLEDRKDFAKSIEFSL